MSFSKVGAATRQLPLAAVYMVLAGVTKSLQKESAPEEAFDKEFRAKAAKLGLSEAILKYMIPGAFRKFDGHRTQARAEWTKGGAYDIGKLRVFTTDNAGIVVQLPLKGGEVLQHIFSCSNRRGFVA